MRTGSRRKYVRASLELLGPRQATRFWSHWLRSKVTRRQPLLSVTNKRTGNPLTYRLATSDTKVFRQIFFDREYECVADLENVGLVIDAGANVGFSTMFFLDAYPNCNVIAVEPDSDSFELLTRNIAPYGARAQAINSAVWSRPAGLTLVKQGEAWAYSTRESEPDEVPDMQATDIQTLLAGSSYERISLLKVDIEGAERVVFADAPWLELVDNIVIELHGEDCDEIFFKAIEGRGFTISQIEERTICRS